MNAHRFSFKPVAAGFVLIALSIALCRCSASHSSPASAPATQPAQETFASPDQAVQAMADAIRANDLTRLSTILGPGSDQIISSGDEVADQQGRQKFLASYDKNHDFTNNSDGSVTLTVGADNWPMPIPIVKAGDAWHFDSQAGLDEVLNRRIGKNELDAIQVCLAIVDAQRDYVHQNPNGGNLPEYARKFFSDPGTKDGLYWPTAPGEPPSPLGELVADAADEGYTIPIPHGTPYHGYFYHILKSQGPGAEGGARDYLVNGKLIGGFAVVAHPAQYGNSGIMTFIVNYQGVVYQKDLGPDTDSIVKAMTSFDPDSTWKPVDAAQAK